MKVKSKCKWRRLGDKMPAEIWEYECSDITEGPSKGKTVSHCCLYVCGNWVCQRETFHQCYDYYKKEYEI